MIDAATASAIARSPERVFTPDELRALVTPAGDLACEALEAGDAAKARRICVESKDMHRPVHNNYLTWNAQTLAHIAKEYGLETLHEALRESIAPFLRPIAETFRNGVTREAVSSLAQIFRMYCQSIGPAEEDDELIRLHLGSYGDFSGTDQSGCANPGVPPADLSLAALHSQGGNDPRVPLFSAAALHGEALMTRWLGYPPFVIDSHRDGTRSSLVIYKNPSNIPQRLFDRIGEKRDSRLIRGAVDVAGGRLFCEQELRELGRQHMERAVAAIDAGDIRAAMGWCQLSKGEWYPGHHIHRDWIAGVLSYVYRKFGADAAYDAVLQAYNTPILEPMLNAVKEMSPRDQVESLAAGFRQHAMRFRIEEDADKFIFATEPCGSGGRLVQEDAYELPKNFARIKERHRAGFYIEDFPIYCMHCPATNELALRRGGPYYLMVDGDLMMAPTGNCNFYIFKNPDAVPDRFYRRAGLDRSACGSCGAKDRG